MEGKIFDIILMGVSFLIGWSFASTVTPRKQSKKNYYEKQIDYVVKEIDKITKAIGKLK